MKLSKVCVLFLVLASVAFAEIAPAKRQEIDKLLQLTGMSKLLAQMKTQMIASYQQAMPQAPAEFWMKFDAKLDMNELLERIMPVYDKYYTLEDLQAVNAFYATPVGQKLLSSLPAVMQDSMQIGQQWGQEMGEAAAKDAAAAAESAAPVTPKN